MNVTEELENKGFKIEELNAAEKKTYLDMLEAVEKAQLTPEKIKDYISSMRDAVIQELTKTDITSGQDLFLKARLKNYMLFEAFLTSPDKAKRALEEAISGMEKRASK